VSSIADETTGTFANALFLMRGRFVRNYPTRAVFLSELSGVRKGDAEPVYNSDRGRVTPSSPRGRTIFSGSKLAIPVEFNPVQGTGTVSETGTLNTPHTENLGQAQSSITRLTHPISVSLDLEYASKAGPNSALGTGDFTGVLDAVKMRMQGAERIMPRVFNEMLHGNGDALLAAFTAGATSATQTVGTSANFYQLYAGRIVDVLTRSNGTPVTNGSAITINSTAPASGTVTFSQSITVTTAEGIYIEGSYGTAISGLGQVVSPTGTFEGIDKSLNPGWVPVDGRNGDVSAQDLSMSILDAAEMYAGNNGQGPDFYIGDGAVINRYTQTLTTQSQWAGNTGTLETGWTGVKYRDKLLIADRDSKLGRLVGVDMSAYGLMSYFADGPQWIDDTGAIFMRFNRKLPREGWLWDPVQFVAYRTNTTVVLDGLNRST
jgi:hypothetical protein